MSHPAMRAAMVRDQIEARGIRDPALLEAMRTVERHRFVPEAAIGNAYRDGPVPIGHGQTISQPYIVARMIEAAGITPGARVLEVGSGSGYVAALLAAMGADVVGIEREPHLAEAAAARLAGTGVDLRCGDGKEGAPNKAPFDAILVSATGDAPPPALVDQLAEGGQLVMPVRHGAGETLFAFCKRGDRLDARALGEVRFVPLL